MENLFMNKTYFGFGKFGFLLKKVSLKKKVHLIIIKNNLNFQSKIFYFILILIFSSSKMILNFKFSLFNCLIN